MFDALKAVHLVAVAWWIGGQLMLAAVVVPAARRIEDEAERTEVIRAAGWSFMRGSAVALIVLLITGIGMVTKLGYGASPPDAFNTKMLLVVLTVLATVWHVVASRARRRMQVHAASGITMLLSLGVLWMATRL